MSGDFHITRAKSWFESNARPVLLSEWVDVATSDPRLQHRGAGLFVAEGLRADDEDAAFWWSEGSIDSHDPDKTTLALMSELALRLDAQLQDDDGCRVIV